MSDLWNSYPDVPGQCNAHCYIGDNYGDGSATMRCSLEPEHEGWHKESFREDKCVLSWEKDERCYHTDGYHYDPIDGALRCETCSERMSEVNCRDSQSALAECVTLVKWDGYKFIVEPPCEHVEIYHSATCEICLTCGDVLKNPELAPI